MSAKATVFQFLLDQQRTADGGLLLGGKVSFYEDGTLTPKTVWLDRDKATPAANPFTLDSDGTAQLFGDGNYRIVIKDSAGAIQFDRSGINVVDYASSNTLTLSSNDYVSLDAAVTAIGSTPATLIITSVAFPALNNVTVPATLTLEFMNSGSVTIASGKLVTINSAFSALLKPVFTGSGKVLFTAGTVEYVAPEWFGAKSDGTSASATAIAIQKAFDSLPGTPSDMSLTTLAPGGTVQFAAGTYAVDAELIINKANSRIIGQGSFNTIIKYTGNTNITNVIKVFEVNHGEVSSMRIDGNASSVSVGAKACLGIDQVSFFKSDDVYLANSTLYGLRASRLWESYFSNLYIRGTGYYSTALIPGAAILFSDIGATSTLFPANNGSNNTTFFKPTLVPYGCICRQDVTAPLDNISFIDPITETDLATFDIPASRETFWTLQGSGVNFKIAGGFCGLNGQTIDMDAIWFVIEGSQHGLVIRDHYIDVRKTTYTRTKRLIGLVNNAPSMIDITVHDRLSALTYVLYAGGQNYTSDINGHITYINNGATPRTINNIFESASAKQFFRGNVTIQNGISTTGSAEKTLTYITQGSGMVALTAANTNYFASGSENVILVDASGGPTTVQLGNMQDGMITVKKIDSTANAAVLNLAGGTFHTIDSTGSASYSIVTPRAVTVLKAGLVVYVMDGTPTLHRYINNAAALAGGLFAGAWYQTSGTEAVTVVI